MKSGILDFLVISPPQHDSLSSFGKGHDIAIDPWRNQPYRAALQRLVKKTSSSQEGVSRPWFGIAKPSLFVKNFRKL
jgi:hypothetical protein